MAIALAPATGPRIYGVGILLGSGYPYSGPGHMEKHLLSVAVLMTLSYPVSIVLGMIIVGSLHFTRRLTGLNCIAWALVAGTAVGIAFCLLTTHPPDEAVFSGSVILSAGFAALAALTALVFCLIAGLPLRKTVM
ncbi:MAG: hypothetical protein LCH86_02230 [Proteobacteria bacterium]|nr:hypothetical protein [Pseudomonadota bacterium]